MNQETKFDIKMMSLSYLGVLIIGIAFWFDKIEFLIIPSHLILGFFLWICFGEWKKRKHL